jgi:hypothetical protein
MANMNEPKARMGTQVDATTASNAVVATVTMYAQALEQAQRTIDGFDSALRGAMTAAHADRTKYLTSVVAEAVRALEHDVAAAPAARRDVTLAVIADLKAAIAPQQDGPAGPGGRG